MFVANNVNQLEHEKENLGPEKENLERTIVHLKRINPFSNNNYPPQNERIIFKDASLADNITNDLHTGFKKSQNCEKRNKGLKDSYTSILTSIDPLYSTVNTSCSTATSSFTTIIHDSLSSQKKRVTFMDSLIDEITDSNTDSKKKTRKRGRKKGKKDSCISTPTLDNPLHSIVNTPCSTASPTHPIIVHDSLPLQKKRVTFMDSLTDEITDNTSPSKLTRKRGKRKKDKTDSCTSDKPLNSTIIPPCLIASVSSSYPNSYASIPDTIITPSSTQILYLPPPIYLNRDQDYSLSVDIFKRLNIEFYVCHTAGKIKFSTKDEAQYFQAIRILKDNSIEFFTYELEAEKHTRKGSVQCYRCQQFGHNSWVCFMPVKCLKCAGNHFSFQCDLTKEKAEKYANPANFKKCPAFPMRTKTLPASAPIVVNESIVNVL